MTRRLLNPPENGLFIVRAMRSHTGATFDLPHEIRYALALSLPLGHDSSQLDTWSQGLQLLVGVSYLVREIECGTVWERMPRTMKRPFSADQDLPVSFYRDRGSAPRHEIKARVREDRRL